MLSNDPSLSDTEQLKGMTVFTTIGDKAYSIAYLAKANDFDNSLDIVQQMVESFEIG